MNASSTKPDAPASPARRDDPIVGIDLGTTNSLVAWCDEAGPRILRLSDDDSGMVPSVVRYGEDGRTIEAVGDEARRHAVEFPGRTIYSVKRLMGRGLEDARETLPYLAYDVVEGEHHTARVKVGERLLSPQEVSSVILRTLKARAEKALGCEVKRAVVTVPAYFDDAQRQATRDAGRIAGLDVVRIVNEPTAAALAYNVGQAAAHAPAQAPAKTGKPSGVGGLRIGTGTCSSDAPASPEHGSDAHPASATVAVFDLGGGTFDISILRLQRTEDGVIDQVLATAGDTHLGGDDFDQTIIELVQSDIREQYGQALAFPPSTRQALRNFAEATKIRLSQEDEAQLEIDLGDERVYRRTLTRDQFEQMIQPLVDCALNACRQALRGAGLTPADIERVIMVGGSTRVPLVRRSVAELFDTTPYTAMNPDEVVALGAAVQASIQAGVNRDMLLLDVIPLSLGIETMGGAVAKLITANTTIPARATERFTTYADGQTNVKIHVLQGERELVADCRSLGEFELRGIPPMPAGLPKVDVTFLVDANGILNVSAVEERSGKAARIQIVPNHGLTRDEVARMEQDSFDHARGDMDAHRRIDLRNQARLDLRAIGRQLDKVGDELDADLRAKIEAAAAELETLAASETADLDQLQRTLTELDHMTVPLAELAIQRTLREETST